VRVFVIVAVGLLAASMIGGAQGVDFDQERKDAPGDVYNVSTASMSGAGAIRVEGHDDVDIRSASSQRSGERLVLAMTVVGRIRDDRPAPPAASDTWDQFDYRWALDVRGSTEHEYLVSYVAGAASMANRTTDDSFSSVALESTRAGGTMTLLIPVREIGAAERFDWAAAAMLDTCSGGPGPSSCRVMVIDSSGAFPGYSWLENKCEEADGSSPAFVGVIAAVGAALAVSSIASRNPRNKER